VDPQFAEPAFVAFSASGLIAGKKLVKFRPLLRAPSAEAYPRKVTRRARAPPGADRPCIDDPRFVRVKPQADLVRPRGDPTEHQNRLGPALAMHDTIVGIALPRAARNSRTIHESNA